MYGTGAGYSNSSYRVGLNNMNRSSGANQSSLGSSGIRSNQYSGGIRKPSPIDKNRGYGKYEENKMSGEGLSSTYNQRTSGSSYLLNNKPPTYTSSLLNKSTK